MNFTIFLSESALAAAVIIGTYHLVRFAAGAVIRATGGDPAEWL